MFVGLPGLLCEPWGGRPAKPAPVECFMRLLVLWMLASTALAKKPKVVEPPPPEPEPVVAPVVVDPDPLDELDLEGLPLWTSPYAKTVEEQGPYLAITKVMARESFTRLQAIEVQDALRDTVRAGMSGAQTPLAQAYADAVNKVRGGQLQSGLDSSKLAAAPFTRSRPSASPGA